MSEGSEHLKRLGYILHPGDSYEGGNTASLEFIIFSDHQGDIFIPQHVTLPVISREKAIETVKISHPWTQQAEYSVSMGRVEMQGKNDEKVVVFTFGGKLFIDNQESYLTGLHESPAPIFLLKEDMSNLPTQLADQVMILLKTHRAEDDAASRSMQRNIANTSPLHLYMSSLKALRAKFAEYSNKNSHHMHEFVQFVESEIHKLEKAHGVTENVPKLDELIRGGMETG